MHTRISSHGLKRSWRSCPRWVNAGNKKHTQHAPSTKTECDYLNGWIKKRSHTQKSHPKVVNPRGIAGERKKKQNSHPKEFLGEMEIEPMLTPREKSHLLENVPRGGSNLRRCGQRAQALPTELFRPPWSEDNETDLFRHQMEFQTDQLKA